MVHDGCIFNRSRIVSSPVGAAPTNRNRTLLKSYLEQISFCLSNLMIMGGTWQLSALAKIKATAVAAALSASRLTTSRCSNKNHRNTTRKETSTKQKKKKTTSPLQ